MTLAITLVAPWGILASVDHRITKLPSGRVVTNNSVKHVLLECSDGWGVLSYTGIGRIGKKDISVWIREILRGDQHTFDETLVDLRNQATRFLAPIARQAGIEHSFFAGAFLGNRRWVAEIRNFEAPTPLSKGGVGAGFKTAAIEMTGKPMLLVGGSGRSAINERDRDLLGKLITKRPRKPGDFMQLLADVNSRIAQSKFPGAKMVSQSCTVVFIPPSGPSDGKVQWYGPPSERPKWPHVSHIFHGVDFGTLATAGELQYESTFENRVLDSNERRLIDLSGQDAVTPKGRRNV